MASIACSWHNTIVLTCAAALLAGCVAARDRTLPPVPMPKQWASSPITTPAVPAQAIWWRSFNDPVLNRLIDDALRTNNDLSAAAIRMHRAQLRAGLANTNLTPNVTLSASANMSHTFSTRHTVRTSGINGLLSYELDLWGRLADQRDIARKEAEATVADRDAMQLSLVGTTAALYWQVSYLNQQIEFGAANIAHAEQTLALVKSRYAAGAASGLDAAQAEHYLASQRATQTHLIQQRTETRHALAILFDRPPQQAAVERPLLPDMALPGVRAGLPADLLGQRPDLRAAESRLRALLSHIDATRKSFYPSFSLTGQLGTSSPSLERVVQNPLGTLGLGLALPFIQWNTMNLQIKVSTSEYEEAVVNFRQKLYGALAEVENALSARVQLDIEGEQLALSLAQAQRAETLAKARYAAGATGVQPWLDQQKLLREAQSACALNQLNRLNNRMGLYKALGGGTQNESLS